MLQVLGMLFIVLNAAASAYNFSTGHVVMGTINAVVALILLIQFAVDYKRNSR